MFESGPVRDDEILYRCVFYKNSDGILAYSYDESENKVYVSSQAFRDRGQCPSVDRACLCNNNPIHTQRSDENGVISLVCASVRQIDSIAQRNSKGKVQFVYKIDVIERAEENNPAHAQIEPNPEYQSRSVFRRLRERLAFLANERDWEILPIDMRTRRTL